jgi:hypothetical protein
LSKIYIGKPEIKHFNNKVNITLYIYNRQIVYLMKNYLRYKNIINKLNKLIKTRLNKFSLKNINITSFINKISVIIRYLTNKLLKIKILNKNLYLIKHKASKNNIRIVVNFCNYYLNKNKIISRNIKLSLINLSNIYVKSYFEIVYNILKIHIILNKYKFNINNLLNIKNLLYYVYNKTIEFNLVNLKYLHLDSYILSLAIVKKLKNRNRRVLRVIRLALKLFKRLYIQEYSAHYLNINNIDTSLINKETNKFLSNLPFNKNIIKKPLSFNLRIVLYYLSNKIIKGIRLQGDGRLTKRLTASRSIIKNSYKGSLKNDKSSIKGLSTILLKGYVKSNLQYTNINSYNLIGAYGIKS